MIQPLPYRNVPDLLTPPPPRLLSRSMLRRIPRGPASSSWRCKPTKRLRKAQRHHGSTLEGYRPRPLHQELDTDRQQAVWDPSSVAWSQIHPVSEWDAPNLKRAELDVTYALYKTSFFRHLTHGKKLADVHNNKHVFLHGCMSVLSNDHKWNLFVWRHLLYFPFKFKRRHFCDKTFPIREKQKAASSDGSFFLNIDNSF